MTKQTEIFRNKEANQYFLRNREILNAAGEMSSKDAVISALKVLPLRPKKILEIGCSNGWRLEALRELYDAECFGVEPSDIAVKEGERIFPQISLQVGTAEHLLFDDNSFDLIIYGFCLYLCDRNDLFKIAAEADRVLQSEGHLVIFDFHPPFQYRNLYAHHNEVYTYKMDYARMFLWNPSYLLAYQIITTHSGIDSKAEPNDRLAVSILYKDISKAYPNNPFCR